MTTELYNWRIATTEAGLLLGNFPLVGLPPLVQFFPRDYSEKRSDAVGGVNKEGFMTYEVLFTRLDTVQRSQLGRLVNVIESGQDLYFTGLWYDSNNPVIRWVDLKGKPDLSDSTPNPPAFAYGSIVWSATTLKFNDVALVNDPAVY